MSRFLSFGLVTLVVAGLGCGGDDDPTGPVIDTGTLFASTVTTGDNIDPNGYMLLLDGSESGVIGTTVTAIRSDLPVGPYLVQLTDIAANCTVSGDNPRTEEVTKDGNTHTVFEIGCQVM